MGDEPADEIGVRCDVEECGNLIVGLDDGWEYGRGLVCQDCIDFNDRHGHWPDDVREWCRQCVLDGGGIVHHCPESSVDVLLRPGDDCPNCDFEVAMTDGPAPSETERHVALCSGGGDSVAATHAAMVFGPATQVIYLNTRTGPGDGAVTANGEWVREWCESNNWPFRSMMTAESYAAKVAENGYPGPSRHFIMYQKLKDRQLCQLAAETIGDLHCWTGIRRFESERRMRHVEPETERADGRWYWRAPLANWTDERVDDYRERFNLSVSPVSESIGRSADCWCGCFGDRAELIDLAAAGFEEHADWLESLETPDDAPREQQRWAGYNWEKHDWAAEDDAQVTLCSDCGSP